MSRTRCGVAVLVAFAAALGGPAFALAAESAVAPGSASGAEVIKTGWWWRANDTSELPPEASPGTDALPPPPPPKNVPEGSLPVAAALGEPENLTAIEFSFDAEPGAVVSSFVLSLRESEEPGANVGADAESTKVAACAVTEPFWTGGEAAAWRAKPEFDDGTCQPGVRGTDGVWTFDLTSFAGQWLGTDQVTSGSVVLVEQVEPPESFQVTYDGMNQEGIGIKLVSTPGQGSPGTGTPGSADGETGDSAGIGDLGAGPTSDFVSDLVDGGSESGAADTGEVPAGSELPLAAQEQSQAPQPQAAGGQPFLIAPSALEDIPASIWILAPAVLGLAYLMMLALGPGGEPTLIARRRGVSRALDRWRSSGRAAAEGTQ